ncbi:Ada metal-binding domain-containing protein [Flavobacterium humi]|uniref:Metal-binding protein n=1 Tax=Flavobacterium humi TaxID=2562683 RepID=A0A4Z0L5S8_9FLAO|nr:Ada metal-binding domain-containing protein [Flavobacterium humi]TGD57060.1 metal-binding protein [Flavobacterium humi]
MLYHSENSDREVRKQIRGKGICFGGNLKLKIYGMLHCNSGKRMKRENRVFFLSSAEAKENGFRPCGHCMKAQYRQWKGLP